LNKIKKAVLNIVIAGLFMASGNTVYANPIAYNPVEEMLSSPIFYGVIVIVIIIVVLIVRRIKNKKK